MRVHVKDGVAEACDGHILFTADMNNNPKLEELPFDPPGNPPQPGVSYLLEPSQIETTFKTIPKKPKLPIYQYVIFTVSDDGKSAILTSMNEMTGTYSSITAPLYENEYPETFRARQTYDQDNETVFALNAEFLQRICNAAKRSGSLSKAIYFQAKTHKPGEHVVSNINFYIPDDGSGTSGVAYTGLIMPLHFDDFFRDCFCGTPVEHEKIVAYNKEQAEEKRLDEWAKEIMIEKILEHEAESYNDKPKDYIINTLCRFRKNGIDALKNKPFFDIFLDFKNKFGGPGGVATTPSQEAA